ncbi:uncharacterized protein [Ptychodera flava]|uniref:uncharacterized protein n=1 Tax=Ptychodera flava TaxID=63121 RepID=UPI00396A53CF
MGFRYSHSLFIIWSTVICTAFTALTGAQSIEPPMSGDDHCHDPTDPGHVHPTEDTAGHSMHMYFHFNEVCILFQNWHPSSTGAWIVSCLIVCICALLYEGLKESRQILMRRKATPDKSTSDVNGGDSEMSWTQRMFNSSHVIQQLESRDSNLPPLCPTDPKLLSDAGGDDVQRVAVSISRLGTRYRLLLVFLA